MNHAQVLRRLLAAYREAVKLHDPNHDDAISGQAHNALLQAEAVAAAADAIARQFEADERDRGEPYRDEFMVAGKRMPNAVTVDVRQLRELCKALPAGTAPEITTGPVVALAPGEAKQLHAWLANSPQPTAPEYMRGPRGVCIQVVGVDTGEEHF